MSSKTSTDDNIYETDALLSQYCEFHYGDSYFNIPNFPKECIDKSSEFFNTLPSRESALDLGCSVGRSTFELAKHFNKVTGLDFSTGFIDIANKFREEKSLRYSLPLEGELTKPVQRDFNTFDFGTNVENVNFHQADACNLPASFSAYDFVFCGNLIDRLHSPKLFLQNIHKHISDNGLLVITSPYTWIEEYTPKKDWIGGKLRSGEPLETLKGLQEELSPWFEQVSGPIDVPFVIRETKRKFQHTVSEMSVWRKK